MADCSGRLLSLGNFCTPSYKKRERSVCLGMDTTVVLVRDHLMGNEEVCHPWFAPGGHPKRSVMQACVLLKVSVSYHQLPDPKTATGPMFVNLLPLFFFFNTNYGGKNIGACERSSKPEKPELALIRPSKSRNGRSRTSQATTPLQQ